MSIWIKIATAIRGGVNEAGEAVVDHQALRILDQEIRDADSELIKSKQALTGIIAKRKLAERKVDEFRSKVAEYEGYAMQALDKGDTGLATEIAERIAAAENELVGEEALAGDYARSEDQLRKAVALAEGNLKRLKQQVDTVKATESVQRAQAAVAARHTGPNASMNSALQSLERLKERQTERAARFEAAAELSVEGGGDDLETRLKLAGIKPGERSSDNVLARLQSTRQIAAKPDGDS